MIENINFKVSVRCMTYNQSAYIEDAMNGFCMQQTDFPFVCNVMDDASTDGEQEIIQKYLDSHFDLDEKNLIKKEETDDYKLIFARHKENKNCYFAVFFLKYNHYGSQEAKNKKLSYFSEWESKVDYWALCEGDDYWIDPKKIQNQVVFLDEHMDYGMCYTNYNVLIQDNQQIWKSVFRTRPTMFPSEFKTLDDWIMSKKHIGPMTWVIRNEIWKNVPKFDTVDSTFAWFAFFYANSNVYCMIDETTAVYRIHNSSVTHGESYRKRYIRERGMFDIQMKLLEYYKENLNDYVGTKNKIKDTYYSKLLLIIYNNDKDEITEALNWRKNDFTHKERLILLLARTSYGKQIMFMINVFLNKIKKYIKRAFSIY